jgi:hypothetical protein
LPVKWSQCVNPHARCQYQRKLPEIQTDSDRW